MICDTCKSEGKKSTVVDKGGMKTLAYYPPFYDENGKYHLHDGNTVTSVLECSNGHEWTVTYKGSCWCGWPGENNAETVQSK